MVREEVNQWLRFEKRQGSVCAKSVSLRNDFFGEEIAAKITWALEYSVMSPLLILTSLIREGERAKEELGNAASMAIIYAGEEKQIFFGSV